jgi:hypothetical protein
LKTVSRIELRWIDTDGNEWGFAARIEPGVHVSVEKLQDVALDRLRVAFDDWRRRRND